MTPDKEQAAPGTLVLMTRLPRPGATKSRLASRVGPEAAARLARAFLDDLLERFAACPMKRVVALDGGEPGELPVPGGWRVVPQGAGDLGARMLEAYRLVGAPVVFVGSDAPTLPAACVLEALDLLERGYEAVFQPALDGGYTLAAFAADPEPLLDGVPWGTEDVLARTLAKGSRRAGIMAPWYDVDEEGDLVLLRAHLDVLEGRDGFAPRTRAVLRELLEPSP